MLPAGLPPGFVLAAILAREDPRDAFVSLTHENLAALPAGAVVGTSSLRRQAQIAARYPALAIRPLRGNVETRIAKLDRGDYAGIVLAAAGLVRLGLAARIRSTLSVDESLPAAGQAALGVECLAARGDLLKLLGPLEDAATGACVRAERQVNLALGGSCTIPLGAYAEITGGCGRYDAAARAGGFARRQAYGARRRRGGSTRGRGARSAGGRAAARARRRGDSGGIGAVTPP